MAGNTTPIDQTPITKTNADYPFLAGEGEMATLTRTFDWSKTVIGTPNTWPQSLRTIVSTLLASKFPMFLWWGPDLIQFYNDAYRPSLGNDGKHPKALGQSGPVCWTEIWPTVKPLIDQVMTRGEATWSENQLVPVYRNGQSEQAYWTFSYSPVQDETDQIVGVLSVCQETTQQVLTQLKIEDNQRQVLTYFEQSPVAIAIISGLDLIFQMVNPFCSELMGRKPDQLVGKSLLEALPELAGQGFDQLLKNVMATGMPFIAKEASVDIVRNDQLETIYVDLTYQPRREPDGRISGVLVVATDVTQQVKARRIVEASEARLRSIIATAPAAIGLFVGRDLVVELPNQAFIDIVGKGPDIVGKPLREVMPELENQTFLQILDDVYTSGTMYQSFGAQVNIVQHGVMTHNFYNITYSPLFDSNGKVYAILDIAIDVTEAVKARQQVEKAETILRDAVELAELATWSLDIQKSTFSYSKRFMEWLGFSEDTKNLDEAYNPLPDDYRQSVAAAVAAAIEPGASGVYINEHPIINRLTGQTRIIHVRAQVFYDSEGKPALLSGNAQDVTQQRKMHEALEQQVQERTEELEAINEEFAATNEELTEMNQLLMRSNQNLEQFAYIASHDLQEPLRKIQSFSDILKEQYGSQLGSGTNFLERMQTAASRMSVLIKDLLSFARISVHQESTELVSLSQVVESVLSVLDFQIQETGAVIEVEALPTVRGDKVQLGQLFQNLLSNALKFRKSGISPVVRLYFESVAAAVLPDLVKPSRRAEMYYCISVADNGVGFDEQYSDRIFQVFQRLHGKNEFSGTGVGLAICEKVVTNHGGAISARSQPGHGATFSVYLPVIENP